MTSRKAETSHLPRVFQEPPDGLDSDWTHGVLLVGTGQRQSMEWLEAARIYSATALHLVDRTLSHDVQWDEAHPALFMCRHSLELYLKAAIPDWNTGNGHDLNPLIEKLEDSLDGRYHAAGIERLSHFLREFSTFDPKAMVFRFPDGGIRSGRKDGQINYEIWVDFRALRTMLQAVFEALDRVCLDNKRLKPPPANPQAG